MQDTSWNTKHTFKCIRYLKMQNISYNTHYTLKQSEDTSPQKSLSEGNKQRESNHYTPLLFPHRVDSKWNCQKKKQTKKANKGKRNRLRRLQKYHCDFLTYLIANRMKKIIAKKHVKWLQNMSSRFLPRVGSRLNCRTLILSGVQLIRWQFMCANLCICVCMRVCMHACMHVCKHACMYVCMHVCMYVCMYVCMSVCMCVCA